MVGPEIPLPGVRHTSLYAQTSIAIAPAIGGFVVAWSEQQSDGRWRVKVAEADSEGRIRRGPLEMQPGSIASRYAADPSLAAVDDGYLIAWTEDCGNLAPTCGTLRRLDASLNTAAEYPSLASGSALTLRAFGSRAVLVAGKQMWRIAADGSLTPAPFSNTAFDAAAVNAAGAVAIASHHVDFVIPGGPFCPCGGVTDVFRTVTFTWLGEAQRGNFVDVYRSVTSGNGVPPFNPLPVMASNGCCFLMVWVDQPSASFSRSLRAAVIHSAFEAQVKMTTAARLDYLAEDAQAAAASDGERYLVVWPSLSIFRGDRDILGAAVDADETVQKISIAASPSNESKPAVAALLAGRFVVVYDNGAGTVARIIEFPSPRKRSVR